MAFTLIEVAAATAIAGLLAAAAMATSLSLARAAAGAEGADDRETTQAAARRWLEFDLMHARRYRNLEGGALELESQASFDAGTLRLDHLPATVRYEVRQAAGRSWLLRRQTDDEGRRQAQIVCHGVRAIALRPLGETDVPPMPDFRSLPARATVWVRIEGPGSPRWEWTVRLR